MEGIHNLKEYLEKFGYLNYNLSNTKTHAYADNDDFDYLLESAIKNYHLNYHLNVSGVLDPETASTMIMSRCGVADIINGNTRMLSGTKTNLHGNGSSSRSLHTLSHYSFFPGKLRWPASKHHLTYKFLQGTPPEGTEPVSLAFRTWAFNTHFRFTHARHRERADIMVSVHSGGHGDGVPFDGKEGTVAHAYAPMDGRFHYDADELWNGAYDLEAVALHEIGHLLGLMHSSVEGAIMYPTIAPGVTKD